MSEIEGTWQGYGSCSFTVRKAPFAQLAEWAMAAVPGTTTLPIHGCFQVDVTPAGLTLAGTDQHLSVFASTPGVRAEGEGRFYVSGRKLKALLAEAPDGDVTVRVSGNEVTVLAGGASWTLRAPSPARWPGLPDLDGAGFAPVPRESLLAGLMTVRHAVGKDPGRPAFTQVRVESAVVDEGTDHEGRMMFACAVDSSQFSRAPVPGFPVPLSVPGFALADLVKVLEKVPVENVEVADFGSYAVFRAGTVTLAAAKPSAPFPGVEALFLRPASVNKLVLGVDKADLTRALHRVRVNADASTSAVALVAEPGRLTVLSRDSDGNGAEQVLQAKWEGERLLLAVNAGHLDAALAAHPSAYCEFRVGIPRGKSYPPLLLEDNEARVTAIIPQMPPALVGYGDK